MRSTDPIKPTGFSSGREDEREKTIVSTRVPVSTYVDVAGNACVLGSGGVEAC